MMSKRNHVITGCLLIAHILSIYKACIAFNMDALLDFIAKLPLILAVCVFLAGIKTSGAMMLRFGCNTSQPIPNILADNFFSKNGQVKFWPDNENVGSV